MTAVEFHFNAPDKFAYAVRLLGKAVRKGAHVVVTADADRLHELDRMLWTFEPTAFLPHCIADDAAQAVVDVSPVVLAESARTVAHHDVLLNLGESVPEGFERFERLIEVVTLDEPDRVVARRRWRHYADRGYALKRVDLLLKG